MKNLHRLLFILTIFSVFPEIALCGLVRDPAVSGSFYPDNPKKLKGAVEYFLRHGIAPKPSKTSVIISPHAGYIFSGQIAADAWNQAKQHNYDLIVILGVNHSAAGFEGISIFSGTGYRTPLGTAPVAAKAAKKLIEQYDFLTFKERVHKMEHSVEVQVPFAQVLFPGIPILPVVIATSDTDLLIRFGKVLAKTVQNKEALIVASSDLSHYPAYDDAASIDRKTLNAIVTKDPKSLGNIISGSPKSSVPGLLTRACGAAPIITAKAAALEMGATCGRIISYANSGDTSIGNRQRDVGYGAVSFSFDPECDPGVDENRSVSEPGRTELNGQVKKDLLAFARETIRCVLEFGITPLMRNNDPACKIKRGAFVTLRKHGMLRGCIGHMMDDIPLHQVIGKMAIQAALNDRRFQPLAASELPDTEIEISVLTPFRKVSGIDKITIGKDGVLLRKGGSSAVFLPQVAPEQGWKKDEMLTHLCRKAGLSGDCWKRGAKFYTFQADVFRESELK